MLLLQRRLCKDFPVKFALLTDEFCRGWRGRNQISEYHARK